MVRQEFLHPGFPVIGAIEKFRKSTEYALAEARGEFAAEVNRIEGKSYPIAHTGRTAIKMRKKQDSPLGMQMYFDKSAVTSAMSDIAEEIRRAGRDAMDNALEEATYKTIRTIKQRRAFKSRKDPSGSAPGDLYDTIADSLDARQTWPTFRGGDNQFMSYVAGSFDIDDGDIATGVTGSRGVNLIEITETGTSPFAAELVQNVFRHPAKRHMKEA